MVYIHRHSSTHGLDLSFETSCSDRLLVVLGALIFAVHVHVYMETQLDLRRRTVYQLFRGNKYVQLP